MQFIFRFLLIVVAASSAFSATVQFQTTSLGTVNGQSVFRNMYTLTDTGLQTNQAVDIEFDPALYGTLSNAQGSANLDILLLQPNNPPGAPGLASALALSNTQPPISFSVSFIFLGAGQPSSQRFAINQYSSTGTLISTITSGVTTPAGVTAIPEPGGFVLGGLGLLAISGWRGMRRRPVRKADRNY